MSVGTGAARQGEPLVIADQGHFFTGIQRVEKPFGLVPTGQMFVQYQIPADRKHATPIVMVHGGGGQGLDYLTTPDGRPGWAEYFLRQGYAVYVVDRLGLSPRCTGRGDAAGQLRFHPATLHGLG
jgi:pimeloyl-ACP methyl ester carboxylesterase